MLEMEFLHQHLSGATQSITEEVFFQFAPSASRMEHIIPVTLKWSKKEFVMELFTSRSTHSFKQEVQKLTGVPVERQKLLSKGAWKGSLSKTFDLSTITPRKVPMTVSLIGSSESVIAPTDRPTTFLEDLTVEQIRETERLQEGATLAEVEGMISALQVPPQNRIDTKTEPYQYNRLVTGLPQNQIESLLREQGQDDILGKVAMTMGLELRRAYVNDLAVLPDGTVVSALDDGHIHLWKHGALVQDLVHEGSDGGVDSVVAFADVRGLSFASAGRSCLRLWTQTGNILGALPAPAPGTSPESIVQIPLGSIVTCMAASFRITRSARPGQFRLPPQNDSERQRRAQAEAIEAATQENLARVSKSVQVWFSSNNNLSLRSVILEPKSTNAAAIKSLCVLPLTSASCAFVTGDANGNLGLWEISVHPDSDVRVDHKKSIQLRSSDGDHCSVVAMESLTNNRLAISTAAVPEQLETQSNRLELPCCQAVHILQFDSSSENLFLVSSLNGHRDTVLCMCSLPNGALLTGGGKLDATIQVWSEEKQLRDGGLSPPKVYKQSDKTLEEIGYVFAMTTLTDAKPDSNHFAVAMARYNVVKIVL